MEVIRDLERHPHRFRRPVVTIGNFDGVHIGHQAILDEVKRRAQAIEGESVVYTFEPHPLKVLKPEICPPTITNFRRKMELIANYELDITIAVDFSMGFARLNPREFVEQVICGRIGAREVVVGHDYGFGRGRQGTIQMLQDFGREKNFVVEIIEPILLDGRTVSSTRIRQAVMAGDVEQAANMMGRPFSLEGKVIKGHMRGRKLGFPTANILTDNELLPRRGVYAVYATVNGETYQAVANIGFNPTFHESHLSIEVHLLDFEGDIYNADLLVAFVKRLRNEVEFRGVEALIEQIRQDVDKARGIFATVTSPNNSI